MNTAEQSRLDEARTKQVPWKKWGPYVSERQWGTVREDYSESGDAWNYTARGNRLSCLRISQKRLHLFDYKWFGSSGELL